MVSVTYHFKYHSVYFCYLGAFDLNIGLLSRFLIKQSLCSKTPITLSKSFNLEMLGGG